MKQEDKNLHGLFSGITTKKKQHQLWEIAFNDNKLTINGMILTTMKNRRSWAPVMWI